MPIASGAKDVNAAVFSLPETLKGDENNEVNSIFVDKHTGHDAITQTIELFKLLFIHKNQNWLAIKPRYVYLELFV